MKKVIEFIVDVVIICVVVLIVFPKIDGIVEEIKINSLRVKVSQLVRAANDYVSQNNDTRGKRFDIIDGDLVTTELSSLNYKGKIDNGVVVIDSDSNIIVCVTDGVNSAYKDSEERKIKVVKNQVCNIPRTNLVLNDAGELIESEDSNKPVEDMTSTNEKSSKTVVVLEESTKKHDLVFDTVSQMKNDASIEKNTIIKTKGFYNKNDGGGAYYTITDDNSLTSNNITIIDLKKGLKAKLILEDRVNLKQFGAKGDGVTNDTEFVNLALNNSKNRILYVPKGTYMVGNKVNIVSNVTIIGEGEESLFKALPGMKVSSDMVVTRDRSNIIFKNIAFSGNIEHNTREKGHSASDGIHLFDMWNVSNILIDGVVFKDNVYAAIRIVGGSSIRVVNSKFLNVDCGVITLGSSNVTDLLVENNYFDGHQNSEPISLYGTGAYTNIVFNNNIIKNKRYATAIFAGRGIINNITITNNTINDAATGIVLAGATNGVIKNNKINNEHVLSGGGSGINISSSSNVEVSNNKVEKTSQESLRINDNTDVNIHDNEFIDGGYTNNDFYFIHFNGNNNRVKFYNNRVIRNDNSLYEYLIKINKNSNGSNTTEIINNNVVNGKIILWTDTSGYIVKNNNCTVLDRSTPGSNTVER